MTCGKDLVEQLELQPHPEGGWYRETWRAPAASGERAQATLIHFLLESSQSSHWHQVDATEIWLWHAGNPVELRVSEPESGEVEQIVLGPELLSGHVAQHIIHPHDWQAAKPLSGAYDFSLVSCVVSPGFEFEGFKIAPPEWRPDA